MWFAICTFFIFFSVSFFISISFFVSMISTTFWASFASRRTPRNHEIYRVDFFSTVVAGVGGKTRSQLHRQKMKSGIFLSVNDTVVILHFSFLSLTVVFLIPNRMIPIKDSSLVVAEEIGLGLLETEGSRRDWLGVNIRSTPYSVHTSIRSTCGVFHPARIGWQIQWY
ncbi:hypothetical protein BDV28DRAFT_118983 [Aspergillus coremiiformis]|uniref:Uncharacterized protein n=1 Tax=Aspergillus coremiiformis TaxID=138285 RepID=A0A5N6Z5G8_9EURO|nr:hypothetical protein BDV28DRAFT_118983 [Aspergillus coremiiformis]